MIAQCCNHFIDSNSNLAKSQEGTVHTGYPKAQLLLNLAETMAHFTGLFDFALAFTLVTLCHSAPHWMSANATRNWSPILTNPITFVTLAH